MRQLSGLLSTLTICLVAMLAWGCANVTFLNTDDVISGLSDLILRPQDSCEKMRERFGLTYMPLAETPTDIGMDYEEHWIPVTEDVSLRVWYIPANLDRGTILYSCGNTGEMACYLYSALLLTDNGWSVVIYDYQGHGGSDGQPSLSTLSDDLEAVLEWTRAWTAREQVTLMGMSLGSIPSIAVAVGHPDAVNGVILDSPVALGAQVNRFSFAIGGQTEWLIDQLDPQLLSDTLIGWMQQPLLVFMHDSDTLTTPGTVQLLYDRAAGPKQIVHFPELGHARGQFVDTDEYIYHLEHFLNDIWSRVMEEQPYRALRRGL
ncbi:MAG: alpha/beta fold hydrolase [Planctomycetota bacterium]